MSINLRNIFSSIDKITKNNNHGKVSLKQWNYPIRTSSRTDQHIFSLFFFFSYMCASALTFNSPLLSSMVCFVLIQRTNDRTAAFIGQQTNEKEKKFVHSSFLPFDIHIWTRSGKGHVRYNKRMRKMNIFFCCVFFY